MAIALSVAYTVTPLAAGVQLAIFATAQKSAGVFRPAKRSYKLIDVTAAAAASPDNILTKYTAIFGALVSGKKIFFRLVPINASGQPGAAFETSQIVT